MFLKSDEGLLEVIHDKIVRITSGEKKRRGSPWCCGDGGGGGGAAACGSVKYSFRFFLHVFFILVHAAYIQWGFGTEAKAHWKTNDVYNAVIQNEKDLNSALMSQEMK